MRTASNRHTNNRRGCRREQSQYPPPAGSGSFYYRQSNQEWLRGHSTGHGRGGWGSNTKLRAFLACWKNSSQTVPSAPHPAGLTNNYFLSATLCGQDIIPPPLGGSCPRTSWYTATFDHSSDPASISRPCFLPIRTGCCLGGIGLIDRGHQLVSIRSVCGPDQNGDTCTKTSRVTTSLHQTLYRPE
jgi:hypothetical protein